MTEVTGFIVQLDQQYPGSGRELVTFPSGEYMIHFRTADDEYVLAYLPRKKSYRVSKAKNLTDGYGWKGATDEFSTFQAAKQFALELLRGSQQGN